MDKCTCGNTIFFSYNTYEKAKSLFHDSSSSSSSLLPHAVVIARGNDVEVGRNEIPHIVSRA
ncbi:unnamed protein product [Musa acuminata subsp. burmannicoides]